MGNLSDNSSTPSVKKNFKMSSINAVALPSLSTRIVSRRGATQKSAARPLCAKNERKSLICRAGPKEAIAAVTTATTSALVAASPALAVVDERMNGDGTALSLGVNDPIVGWAMLGVFTTIWGLYYAAGMENDKQDAQL